MRNLLDGSTKSKTEFFLVLSRDFDHPIDQSLSEKLSTLSRPCLPANTDETTRPVIASPTRLSFHYVSTEFCALAIPADETILTYMYILAVEYGRFIVSRVRLRRSQEQKSSSTYFVLRVGYCYLDT